MELLDFYKNKRVLITGHTGFKGGWLSIWLKYLDAEICGYALDPEYIDGIYISSKIFNDIIDVRGDIRDLDKLVHVFKEFKPEIVFHFAAQPLVITSYKNPVETFEVNVQGTANILEAIRLVDSVRVAVMVTSDKCYENKEWFWSYREIDPLGGYDPYSSSKAAAELIISSYRNSFFQNNGLTAVSSVRAGNVIGGGDWSAHRIVPDFFRALKKNVSLEIRNPDAVRPWQHVLEPLLGYMILAKSMYFNPQKFSGPWNFGPETTSNYTVRNLVEELILFSGKGSWHYIADNTSHHEAGLLKLDISKAKNLLEWKPVLSFSECVKLTTQWYLKDEFQNTLDLTLNQINYFVNKFSELI